MLRTAVALFVLLAVPARAAPGDYHEGATLSCSECHVMHAGRPSPGAPGAFSEALPRVGELLREDVDATCLACHDDSGRAADVLGPNLGRGSADVRQAGALNRIGGPGLASTGHTLGSLERAPGSSPPWSAEEENGPGRGLSCINCHGHHGSASGEHAYRNLRSDAGRNPPGRGLVTYNHERPGANDLTRDVFVRRALSYDEASVDLNEPDARGSAFGRFCAGCHELFHGQPGSDRTVGGEPLGRSWTRFLRHPDAGVDVGSRVGGASLEVFARRGNKVKVMSATGQWSPPAGDVTPTCVTCHKAHGNRNAFGLIYRSGSGRITEEGDTGGGALEHLCGQCHAEDDGRP